jgi:hypothetical protein
MSKAVDLKFQKLHKSKWWDGIKNTKAQATIAEHLQK